MSSPLRIALLGCGQIADAHLQEIRKLRGVELVAVCDVHRDLAVQAGARFGVPGIYTDLRQMIAEARPDVVHITTPAHTHCSLAIQILQLGCHVYVEKPFTLDGVEADRVAHVAAEQGKHLCLGHDQLFDPMWLELRRRVETGEVGPIRHVESILGYPISGQFGTQVTSDPNHWVRKLPGGLFQNTISHPLYRITDFLTDDRPQIDATWTRTGKFPFPTELQVSLRGETVTGSLTFLSTIASQRITRVYGTKGYLEVDFDAQTVRRIGPPTAPGAFGKLQSPFKSWREAARNFRRNLWRFAKADIHYFAGMKTLFARFYAAIQNNTPLPIEPAEMVRVTRLMDEIFDCCRGKEGVHHEGSKQRKAVGSGQWAEGEESLVIGH
jgi:predicted dehydrogenase